MRYEDYRYLILADLYRSCGRMDLVSFLSELLSRPRFKFLFWMRSAWFTRSRPLLKYTLYPLARWIYQHYSYKFGFDIPFSTRIGSGFYIGHFGSIVINPHTVIGRNCNIAPGVVIGQTNRGPREGVARIGDNVYIGPGAKILGAITIGDNVAIGANAVVTRDVPAGAVVAGIPAKVISEDGSAGYINRTDYDRLLRPSPPTT